MSRRARRREFNTIRHPASGVPLPWSVTGRLPTTTYPPPKDRERGGEPDAARACARKGPVNPGEEGPLPGTGDLDDRRSGPLQVGLGVEVAYEGLAFATSLPTDLGTLTIPYGFTSPFFGTVDAMLSTCVEGVEERVDRRLRRPVRRRAPQPAAQRELPAEAVARTDEYPEARDQESVSPVDPVPASSAGMRTAAGSVPFAASCSILLSQSSDPPLIAPRRHLVIDRSVCSGELQPSGDRSAVYPGQTRLPGMGP